VAARFVWPAVEGEERPTMMRDRQQHQITGPISGRPQPAAALKPHARRRLLLSGAVLLPLVLIQVVLNGAVDPAAAAPPPGDPVWGADVSYPQCHEALPTGQAFGIVGVNGGTPTSTNPCLARELDWARQSSGATVHDNVQLYVNTANPGAGDPSWPRSGSNRYGTCDGADSTACAYQYGSERAREDATARGISNPHAYMWWLDVEVANTWDSTSTARNVAVLEGMTEYFDSLGVRGIGLYSSRAMWQQITGTAVGTGSSLNGLSNWRPTGSTLDGAKAACHVTPLTPGGVIEMTQYVARGPDDPAPYDYNYSCI
jgi:hypothetical protein